MRSEPAEEARRLFELAERETDPEHKLLALEEALDLIDDMRADITTSASVTDFANNLRQSHLRRLLYQLVSMRQMQIDAWFNYLKLLLLRVAPEVEEIIAADQELRKNYHAFKDLWKDELLELLQRS